MRSPLGGGGEEGEKTSPQTTSIPAQVDIWSGFPGCFAKRGKDPVREPQVLFSVCFGAVCHPRYPRSGKHDEEDDDGGGAGADDGS